MFQKHGMTSFYIYNILSSVFYFNLFAARQKEIEQKIWELASSAGSTLDRSETGSLNSELMRTLRAKYQGMGP